MSTKMNTCSTTVLAENHRDLSWDELRQQIGFGNLATISGCRAQREATGAIVLQVGHGYSVRITLDASDTYNVERIFTRSGVRTCKGIQTNVYADDIGEVAYQASCYVNVPFGEV